MPEIGIVQETQEHIEAASGQKPILAFQLIDAGEFAHIRGYERVAKRKRMRPDEQIVAAYRLAFGFKRAPDCGVSCVHRSFQGQDIDFAEHFIHQSDQARGLLSRGAKTQLSGDDYARAYHGVSRLADAICHTPAWIADGI